MGEYLVQHAEVPLTEPVWSIILAALRERVRVRERVGRRRAMNLSSFMFC